MPLHVCLAVLLLCTAVAAESERPFLHPLFADHMVVPRDRPVPVWGWTTPGAAVRVRLAGAAAAATAGADGRWQAILPATPAGGPHELAVEGPQRVVRGDVLVGEVWLFSGQSNMEMGVGGADGGAAENASAGTATGLRLLLVNRRYAATPRPVPWPGPAPAWQVPAANGIGGFSAVAWFTGRRLQAALQVPVGVVCCAKSGSNIRGWMSEGALDALALYGEERKDLAALAAVEAAGGPDVAAQERAAIDAWWMANDPGTAQRWQDPASAATGAAWRDLAVPGAWKDLGAPADGVTWIRRTVEVPAAAAGKAGRLRLGPILDEEVTWLNGRQIGSTGGWTGPRTYQIPAGLLTAGANLIAIRTWSVNGRGCARGTAGELQLEIDGQPPLPLVGAWRFAHSAPSAGLPAKPVPRFQGGNRSPTMLFNGGVGALAPFPFAGVVWYQGEQDAGDREYYRLLPALIADWRRAFADPALPFVVVQLPSFHPAVPAPVQEPVWFALVRDAQLRTVLATPRTGLAVTTDLGDPDDVHPRRKREVGERAAAAALAVAHGAAAGGGPRFASAQAAGAAMRVTFANVAGGGLELRPGEPSGFALRGADGAWRHARAHLDGDAVVVKSPEVAQPAAVRYGWAETPPVTLYDRAGFPASPFRSDR